MVKQVSRQQHTLHLEENATTQLMGKRFEHVLENVTPESLNWKPVH